jgi:hypothetical protein
MCSQGEGMVFSQTGKGHMIFNRKIHPGQPGSKKYIQEYGDRFVCVRHLVDTQKQNKYVGWAGRPTILES